MKVVWKYRVGVTDELKLDMPNGAQFLCVQPAVDRDRGDVAPFLWVLVDPDVKKVPYQFIWLGTGHPTSLLGDTFTFQYIGTVQDVPVPGLVFHLFRVG